MPAPILLVTSLNPTDEILWRDALAAAMPDEVIVTPSDRPDLGAVEIAIVANPPAESLRALPKLRWVHSLWAGVDRLMQDSTLPDVPVVRLVDPTLARAMAEGVAAAVLYLHRDLHVYAAQQRQAEWRQHPVRFAHERKVCLLGLGEMGRAAATLLAALGFDLCGWSRSGTAIPGMRSFAGTDGLPDAVSGVDILVNLLPLTPETREILNADLFARMAPGAALVNCGRGQHLAEGDLQDALATGRISHAVLDVFTQEPLPAGHPFWQHPGVTILPHVAAPTNRTSASAIVAQAVTAYRRTGIAPTGIDRTRGY